MNKSDIEKQQLLKFLRSKAGDSELMEQPPAEEQQYVQEDIKLMILYLLEKLLETRPNLSVEEAYNYAVKIVTTLYG